MQKPSTTLLLGLVAVALVLSALAFVRWRAATAIIDVGFWYEDFSYRLPDQLTDRIGGPLTVADIDVIQGVSRDELARAFAGLRIAVTDRRDAIWRIGVVYDIPRTPLGMVPRNTPRSGEMRNVGFLGGTGSVEFQQLAFAAFHYAPEGATRADIIRGIGRGIGRTAAHEFGHAMGLLGHSDDPLSYEAGSWDRAAQYYGELHWAAWPLLQDRFGK
jgi:hypothetical protein